MTTASFPVPSFPVASFPVASCAAVRARLLARDETALLDVREEDPFAQEHPLWAANLPLSRIEIEAWRRIPRRDTFVVLYGAHGGTDLAPRAARTFAALGYTNVHLLEGGLEGWRAAGGELFRDVNVPSKVVRRAGGARAPYALALPRRRSRRWWRASADVVVLDARRFDEYQHDEHSDRGHQRARRRAGAARARAGARPGHAGDRQLRGPHAQHHRHAVAGQRRHPQPGRRPAQRHHRLEARRPGAGPRRRRARHPPRYRGAPRPGPADARRVADAPACAASTLGDLPTLEAPVAARVYRFDVRTPEEYAAGHLPGFASAPGGQLVQETDHQVPVRGARIVLADDDGVRAHR
jgi:rhodanese-related sulfurtransferase